MHGIASQVLLENYIQHSSEWIGSLRKSYTYKSYIYKSYIYKSYTRSRKDFDDSLRPDA